MKYFLKSTAVIIVLISIITFTACGVITESAVKKKIFDKYSSAKGYACEVTVFDSKDTEVTTAYIEITDDDLSFEIKSPAVIRGIKFLKQGTDFSVKYYDLTVDMNFIPQSIKPLLSILPAAFIGKEMALNSQIMSNDTEYNIEYSDPAKSLSFTFDKDSYALTDSKIIMDSVEYRFKFKDFIFMD